VGGVALCLGGPLGTEAGGPGGGVAGRRTLDPVFLAGRTEQYKQVFPALSVVGWYVSGGWIGEEDAMIHSVRWRGGVATGWCSWECCWYGLS